MADRPRVVPVDESNWRAYRDIRLAMLAGAPRAYGTTLAEAAARSDEDWFTFVRRANLFLAYADSTPDAEPIGSVGWFRDEDVAGHPAYLVGMWVEPSVRGSGVGEALVAAVVDAVRATGLDRVVLDVADENARAIAFYRRLGFVPTGVTTSMPWDEHVTESEYALGLA